MRLSLNRSRHRQQIILIENLVILRSQQSTQIDCLSIIAITVLLIDVGSKHTYQLRAFRQFICPVSPIPEKIHKAGYIEIIPAHHIASVQHHVLC